MTGIMMETVVIAFMVGGIFGAITALHLASNNKQPVKIKSDNNSNTQAR